MQRGSCFLYSMCTDDQLDTEVIHTKYNRTEKNLGIINNLDVKLGTKNKSDSLKRVKPNKETFGASECMTPLLNTTSKPMKAANLYWGLSAHQVLLKVWNGTVSYSQPEVLRLHLFFKRGHYWPRSASSLSYCTPPTSPETEKAHIKEHCTAGLGLGPHESKESRQEQ